MKSRNIITSTAVFLFLSAVFSTTAFAATVFGDTMETFSYSKYLPVVVGVTMILEALTILLLSDTKRIVNVSYTVFVANIVTFLITRFGWGILKKSVFFTGMFVFGNGPKKLIFAVVYLLISLIIELPIVYLMLRNFTKKIARLLLSAAAANVISTAATVFFEIYLYNSLVS